jgi:hypothetical protein
MLSRLVGMRLPRILSPALLLALAACGGGGDTPSNPSDPVRTSHNAGRDCLQCHGFSLAGTVYRDDGSVYPGAVVRLTTQPGGGSEVVVSVTADASGNFFTNEPVSWGDGLYTDVQGTGARRLMEATVTGGACNSCHGGGNRIRAD